MLPTTALLGEKERLSDSKKKAVNPLSKQRAMQFKREV